MTEDQIFEKFEEERRSRHILDEKINEKLIRIEDGMSEGKYCPYRNDIVLTKQAVTVMSDKLDTIEKKLDESMHTKLSVSTFNSWKAAAIVVVGGIISVISWMLIEMYTARAEDATYRQRIQDSIDNLPGKTAEILKKDWQFKNP